MWPRSCVDLIPFIATPKGRKKAAKSDEGKGLPQSSKWAQMYLVWSAGSIEKMEAWASLEVQFVGHASRLWWDGVCDIGKFRPARTGIKGVILALLLLLLHLLLHIGLSEPVYWCGKWERQDRLQAVKRFQKGMNPNILPSAMGK